MLTQKSLLGVMLLFAVVCHVQADVITINATYRGWYLNDGYHSISNPNYATGEGDFGGEYFNNFFAFDLSGVSMDIGGAQLLLPVPTTNSAGYVSPDATETLGIFEVSTSYWSVVTSHNSGAEGQAIFSDLGSGTSYGSAVASEASEGTSLIVDLNSAAVNDLNGRSSGEFVFGGTIMTLGSPGKEQLFGWTVGSHVPQLRLSPTPEPSTLAALLGMSLTGLAIRYRRRKK